jgi:hypothetical protein
MYCMKIPTLRERIDEFIRSAPKSKPWYDSENRVWKPGWTYISKRAVMALFLAHRRARALQAMKELDAEIAREEAAGRRRRARRKNAPAGSRRTTR